MGLPGALVGARLAAGVGEVGGGVGGYVAGDGRPELCVCVARRLLRRADFWEDYTHSRQGTHGRAANDEQQAASSREREADVILK